MSEPVTYEQMRDLLREQATLISGARPQSTPSSSGGSKTSKIPDFEFFNKSLTQFAEGARMLADGTVKAGNAMGVAASLIDKIPGLGKGLSGAFKEVGDYAIKTNSSLNEVSKSGISFGGNLGEYASQVRGARLTNQEFEDQVRKNAAAIGGTGSTMDRAAKNYLQFTKDLNESDVARDLQAAGMSAKELADIGMVTMNANRGLNMADAKTKQDSVEAAKELASQINETARVTGKSRQVQIDELKARTDNVKVQAALSMMDASARGNYTAMQAKLSGLGKSIGDVADEIFTGGIRTKEGAAKMAALGPAGAQFEKAIRQSKDAVNEKDKKDAEIALRRATEAVNEYQQSKQFNSQVLFDTSAVGDAARKMAEENLAARNASAGKGGVTGQGETGKPETAEELARRQRIEALESTLGGKIRRDEKGELMKDKKGEYIVDKDPAAQLSQTINKVDRKLLDISAGLVKSMEPLNTQFGRLTEDLKVLNAYLEGMTQEEATKMKDVKDAMAKMKPAGAVDNSNLVDAEKKNKVDTSKPHKPGDKPPPPLTKKKEEEKVDPKRRETGSPGVESFLSGGAFNGMFEQFGKGTPAILHNEEVVATKKQMEGIVDKIAISISQIGVGKSQVEQDKTNKSERDAPSLGSMNFDSIISKLKPPELPNIQSATSNKTKPGENAMASSVENMDKLKSGGNARDMFDKMSSSMEGIVKPNAAGDMFNKMKDSIPGMGQIKPPPMFNDILKNIPTSISAAKPVDTTPKGGYGSGANNPSVAPPPPANNDKKQTPAPKISNEATLDDVKKELVQLNTSIKELIAHSSETADASSRQVRATKSLSGNRFA